MRALGSYLPPVFEGRRRQFRPKRSFSLLGLRLPCDRFGQWARWWWVVAIPNYPCWDHIFPPVFKGPPASAPPQTIISLPRPDCRVTGSASGRVPLVVLVAVQLSVLGLYLPPVFKKLVPSYPPQTIISLPVQLPCAPLGQWARWWCWWQSNYPCWGCICRRCWKAGCCQLHPRRSFRCRPRRPCERFGQLGALVVLVALQLFVAGLYLPPVFKRLLGPAPPQTIISLPVQTAV